MDSMNSRQRMLLLTAGILVAVTLAMTYLVNAFPGIA